MRDITGTKNSISHFIIASFLSGASLMFLLRNAHSRIKRTTEKKNERKDECIYLDYNGTTPIEPSVVSAMLPFFKTHFGNPSSSHKYGEVPKRAIADARESIANLLGDHASPSGVVFTGCGTEADNLAIHLALSRKTDGKNSSEKPHIVTTNIEHPAISVYLESLEREGKVEVTYVAVDQKGVVSAEDVIKAMDVDNKNTVLVTIMFANNETGALQPVQEIAAACHEKSILFHTDAAQAIGKISLEPIRHADMITIVGHKFGAPKGIAALYLKESTFKTENFLLLGGGQESGRRAGTENVPYIVGMGQAAKILLSSQNGKLQWEKNVEHMTAMRQRLFERLVKSHDNVSWQINGPGLKTDDKGRDNCLPNTLSIGIKGIQSGELLSNVGNRVACSAGSACHSHCTKMVSPVLRAMKVPLEYAVGTLRLSVGPHTTTHQIDAAAQLLSQEIQRQLSLRKNEL